MSLPLKKLVGRLNHQCRNALEGAAGLCLSRTHYNVEIEHFLIKLIEDDDGDIAAILDFYDLDRNRLNNDLVKAIDRLKTGNSRPPSLSPDVVKMLSEGWMQGSVQFGSTAVRSAHVLLALLTDEGLARIASGISEQLDALSAEKLIRDLPEITMETAEAATAPTMAAPAGDTGGPAVQPGSGKTPNLDQFTVDLTAAAKAGKIDPVLGRDPEIRQIVDILCRRRQNNPILTGEAGVGKTAVVEGFARRVAEGDVPELLQGVAIKSLDMGLLQAGAGMKGEFENRLKGVIDEVKASPTPIIMFIDEAHTLIGAGGAAGQNDAANLLKPALARGELRTIAATTWAEYKKYFEKDPALTRRFQVVKVEEPDEPTAVQMMSGLVGSLEKHHNVRVLQEAVEDSVKLSHRYIAGRQLPDKSVSLLDTACSRVKVSHAATPPALEDAMRRIDNLATSIRILEREVATGSDHAEALAELAEEKTKAEAERDTLAEQWEKEKQIVMKIRDIRDQLEGVPSEADAKSKEQAEEKASEDATETETKNENEATPPELSDADRAKLVTELTDLDKQLKEVQGENALVMPVVDAEAIAQVVSAWTGIPVGRMVTNEINTVLNIGDLMKERIVGQDHALEAIAKSIRTSRAKLTDPRKPIGVYLFVGTSGVGKTETAIALTELLYGGEQNMTTINMSEFKEEHKVSLLMGSPPGYVGYGEGGVMTEAVRRKPYSVLLLDEMEKAHPGVQDIFYQVFDKGNMKDSEGRDIDFKNTVIIMTSNAATDLITDLCADPDTIPEPDALRDAIYPELLKTFKPAFLGRVTIVPYIPLSTETMKFIVKLQMGRVVKRVRQNFNAEMTYSEEVVQSIADRCTEVSTGGRNIDNILNKTLLPEMSSEFLSCMAEGEIIERVAVGIGEDGQFTYMLNG